MNHIELLWIKHTHAYSHTVPTCINTWSVCADNAMYLDVPWWQVWRHAPGTPDRKWSSWFHIIACNLPYFDCNPVIKPTIILNIYILRIIYYLYHIYKHIYVHTPVTKGHSLLALLPKITSWFRSERYLSNFRFIYSHLISLLMLISYGLKQR